LHQQHISDVCKCVQLNNNAARHSIVDVGSVFCDL